MHIGPHVLHGRALLAPMAGLSDQPFRNICRSFGAALAVSEMSIADTRLWHSRKSGTRLDFQGENGLRVLQIAGSEPTQLAEAARAAAGLGADIVDINMGCPAKKVCKKLSGSALLKDELLVSRILEAVTSACKLPVTLKMRTGWAPDNRNGVRIAKIAEAAGIAALAVHGRTRACMFHGKAEYNTIREIKSAVSIPVFANGDIVSARKASEVLLATGADAVMIGRGALGRPWIFHELNHSLDEQLAGENLTNGSVSLQAQRDTIVQHLNALHQLYGEDRGVRVGRKHLTWYCKYLKGSTEFRKQIVRIESAEHQLHLTMDFLDKFQDLQETLEQSEYSRNKVFSAKENIKKESVSSQTEG
ncbi:MAG: tRNA dihydrouridine synthase DusB [Gammaproteobacteria bacterium]|nr:tRNA dihydrouridine synthase DusB [Gammaproteobacteria bacterium]MCP4091624.1 tRNA dihydrouridine synthase DusB [Gammaproteobacteria bacterium]MCP4276120.1 tRNA dihydrouridine synthase DusB [Gammaproteobacteria bacterium]MCP4830864.1 tRNA dihydrouridine synthase DusB [Gammaproteobacteria bacterium]MCP4929690.1 tRNA dihydrouridine synthase DusB [Gammaproteobacteria bacterium]